MNQVKLMRLLVVVLGTMATLVSTPAHATFDIWDINGGETPLPADEAWGNHDVGWYVPMQGPFTLTEVDASFCPNHPIGGNETFVISTSSTGTVLATGSASVGPEGGPADMVLDNPVNISTGTYFMGWIDVKGQAANIVDEDGVTTLPDVYVGDTYTGTDTTLGPSSFDQVIPAADDPGLCQPIFRFDGNPITTTTPEPSSVDGLGFGAVALAGLVLTARKRRSEA